MKEEDQWSCFFFKFLPLCCCKLYFNRNVVNFWIRVQVSPLSCYHLAPRRVAIKRANCTRRSSSILCGLLSLLTLHKHYPAEVAFHCSTMKLIPAMIPLTLYSPCGGRVMGPFQDSESLPNGLPLCHNSIIFINLFQSANWLMCVFPHDFPSICEPAKIQLVWRGMLRSSNGTQFGICLLTGIHLHVYIYVYCCTN